MGGRGGRNYLKNMFFHMFLSSRVSFETDLAAMLLIWLKHFTGRVIKSNILSSAENKLGKCSDSEIANSAVKNNTSLSLL